MTFDDSAPRFTYPYFARCRCSCGWRGVGLRRHVEDFPTCPLCGRIAERDGGPSLSVLDSSPDGEAGDRERL